MRILLVGTGLAPVRVGAGALETLLAGWAGALGATHDLHVASPGGHDREADAGAAGVTGHTLDGPEGLERLTAALRPDAVLLNNRPGWQRWVAAPTLHLFHNWPDAWDLPAGGGPGAAAAVGRAGTAAVSSALAGVVAATLGRPPATVATVRPFVGDEFLRQRPAPDPGVVLAPNRLLEKKGVRELVAASTRPALSGRRVLVTDFLSPWRSPTAEHLALRAAVAAAPRCVLLPPPASRAAMARLYAGAGVVAVPSIRPEGLGMTALEAQAVGVPVVTSGLGGLAEATFPPGGRCDPSDPDALAAALAAAADLPPADRAGLKERVAAAYSLPRSTASLLTALEEARPPA